MVMPGSILMALLTLIIKLFNVVCVGNGIQTPGVTGEQQWSNTSSERSCGKISVQRALFSASPFLYQPLCSVCDLPFHEQIFGAVVMLRTHSRGSKPSLDTLTNFLTQRTIS